MGALGAVLAHPRFDVINPSSTKLLSKLVFALFLPCLIFTELGAQVTFENMMRWWFIPVNVLLAAGIGCSVGYLVVLLCRPPRRYHRFTVIMTGIGNTGNLPLAIIGSICHNKDSPFGSNCNQAGVAYISFSTWISVIIVYTFVYHMLEAPEYEEVLLQLSEEDEQDGGTDVAIQEVSEASTSDVAPEQEAVVVNGRTPQPSVVESDWPGLMDAHNEDEHRVPFLKKLWRHDSGLSMASEDGDDLGRIACLKEPRMVRKMRVVAERTPLQHIIQPPTIASLLAIAIGLYPRSKSFIFGYSAPLGFVNDSLVILAEAMVPCIMLVLGGTLSGGPGKSELGLRTTIGICVSRLVVLPVIGIGIVELAGFFEFLPQADSMYRFVIFLQYCMPTAILCGAMASLRGYGEKEAASLLFWQHLAAVLSVSAAIALYINYIAYI
jgi:predicted permease